MNGSLQEKLELENFKKTICNHDVILLCETWCGPNSLVDIEGYTRFSKRRHKKRGESNREKMEKEKIQ